MGGGGGHQRVGDISADAHCPLGHLSSPRVTSRVDTETTTRMGTTPTVTLMSSQPLSVPTPPPGVPPTVPTLVDAIDVEVQRIVGFPRQPDVVPFLGGGGRGQRHIRPPPPKPLRWSQRCPGSPRPPPHNGAGGVQPPPCDEMGWRREWGSRGGGQLAIGGCPII